MLQCLACFSGELAGGVCTGPHKEAVEASIRKYSPRPEEEAVPVSVAPVANPWVTG
jgi:hypothetical protein